ncbi:hemicentin-2-like isoform X1 [Galleria mellonella]|uniref:Hemicentin-2-like isoform X1 n=1 Tax=Galleria mellonella TaxID=7137 RepID=A0ABM3MYZ1_GALME|nr:hemicentin-2-like isoform X1 [Galleria mellonella]
MGRRMRVTPALYLLLLIYTRVYTFIPGVDGPVSQQEALDGGNTTLHCNSSADTSDEQFTLLVWYKDNVPIFSFDTRVEIEWSNEGFNRSGRIRADVVSQPTALTISALTEDDEDLYHCRVDFLNSQTRNIGVNLTITVLPSKPFFLDEVGNKVEDRIGPYHEEDTLVLSCLVIGGRPPPHISWYSGSTLVDASDGASDIPSVKENVLYLPLNRDTPAELYCKASNTDLAPPLEASVHIEIYVSVQNVSIQWVEGVIGHTLRSGRPAVAQCTVHGSYPQPILEWWLDRQHLTKHSNQSWNNLTRTSISYLELIPSVAENGATLACVATNTAMAPSRGSKADVIKLNVTYSPIVEIAKLGDGDLSDVAELDPLHLECEVQANPPVNKFIWYHNDSEIVPGYIWGSNVYSHKLLVEEASRRHSGVYSCAASNNVGETRAEPLTITVYYPPECIGPGISLVKETIKCNVHGLPSPDTYFWHVQPAGLDVQHLTTGSPILPLSQINEPLSGTMKASCEAGNGIASQYEVCERIFSLESLRPPQPNQCDLAFEYGEFQMRCIPVENATYYEISVWRMSTSNSSLYLERRGSIGFGTRQALAQGGVEGAPGSIAPTWLVRGALGVLKSADEAGAAACNRYGCSAPLLLRPTENLLLAAEPPWWHFILEKDVGISLGAVVLVISFVVSTVLVVRLIRRPRGKPPPVIQVVQLDDLTRNYIDTMAENKVRASCSLRSCSNGYSDGSVLDEVAPAIDRRRKPPAIWEQWDAPPPDVTLTLHRESAV